MRAGVLGAMTSIGAGGDGGGEGLGEMIIGWRGFRLDCRGWRGRVVGRTAEVCLAAGEDGTERGGVGRVMI